MRNKFVKHIILVFIVIMGYNSNCISQNNEELNKKTCSDSIKSNINKDKFSRAMIYLPAPHYTSKITGKVVIIVWVDKDGSVIKANIDSLKSNTFDKELIGNSIEAAYKAKFSRTDIDTIQMGSVTYNFLRE